MRWVWWIIAFAVALFSWAAPSYAGTPRFCVVGLGLEESPSDSSPREAAAQSATAGVFTARNQLHRLANGLARQLNTSSDIQTASIETAQAFSAYEVAKAQVLYRVQLSPEGMAAGVEIDRLEHQLDEARLQAKLNGVDHSETIASLAMALLNERSAGSRRESLAIAQDEKLTSLRYAWLDADSKLASLKEDHDQQLRVDPQWRAAKAQLEQARTELAAISN